MANGRTKKRANMREQEWIQKRIHMWIFERVWNGVWELYRAIFGCSKRAPKGAALIRSLYHCAFSKKRLGGRKAKHPTRIQMSCMSHDMEFKLNYVTRVIDKINLTLKNSKFPKVDGTQSVSRVTYLAVNFFRWEPYQLCNAIHSYRLKWSKFKLCIYVIGVNVFTFKNDNDRRSPERDLRIALRSLPYFAPKMAKIFTFDKLCNMLHRR